MRIALVCVFAVSLFSCKITTDEPDTFTVAFNANGGSGSIESITKTENEEFELPTNTFTKTGFTFAGWNTKSTPDESSKSYKDKEKIKLTEDLTLYAQWAAGTGTVYKIEYWQQNIADDGYTLAKTEPMTGTTGEETAAKAEETVGFTAKEFAQEKIAADGSSVIKIYYDRKIITLTFDADNGEDKTTVSGKFGAEIVSPSPEKTDFIFTGWITDKIPNESSKSYKDKEKITLTEDLTLYAQWKENPSYSINYNLNEGTNPEDARASYKQDETVVLPVPTREFYDFAGWHLAQDFSGEAIKGWNAGEKTENITLYAKWTVKAENVVNAIKNLPEGTHTICVTGKSINIKNIIETLNSKENTKLNLDLSEIDEWYLEEFRDGYNIVGLTLPSNIREIPSFYDCNNLISLSISENNEYYKSVDNCIYSKDEKKLVRVASGLGKVTILNGVTEIGGGAFYRCKNLSSVEIPETVTNVEALAFSCSGLSRVDISKNVVSIGRDAFSFSNLTSIKIPEGVSVIEPQTFYGCKSLKNIEIPFSVKEIVTTAFGDCRNLDTVNYMGTIEQWNSISVGYDNYNLTSAKIICTDGVINGE